MKVEENLLKLDKECKDAINNEKKESCRAFTKEIDTSTNPSVVWSRIRTMDGRVPTSRPSKVIKHNNNIRLTDTEKANALIKQYANVSKLLEESHE